MTESIWRKSVSVCVCEWVCGKLFMPVHVYEPQREREGKIILAQKAM